MVLDRLEKNTINIKDLTLEEPVKQGLVELTFDPERDIKPATWQALEEDITEELVGNPDFFSERFLNTIVSLKRVAPEKVLSFERFSELKNLLGKDIIEHSFIGHPDAFIEEAYDFKILFPQDYKQLQIPAPEITWGEVLEYGHLGAQAHSLLGGAGIPNFPEYMMRLKVINPEIFEELNLGDQTYESMKAVALQYSQDGQWDSFANLVARIKVIFPQKDKHLSITDEEWRGMKGKFDLFQDPLMESNLLSIYQDMMILKAEDIQITDTGINLIMPKVAVPFTNNIPLFPRIRKF